MKLCSVKRWTLRAAVVDLELEDFLNSLCVTHASRSFHCNTPQTTFSKLNFLVHYRESLFSSAYLTFLFSLSSLCRPRTIHHTEHSRSTWAKTIPREQHSQTYVTLIDFEINSHRNTRSIRLSFIKRKSRLWRQSITSDTDAAISWRFYAFLRPTTTYPIRAYWKKWLWARLNRRRRQMS